MCNICDPPRRHWRNEGHVIKSGRTTRVVLPRDFKIEDRSRLAVVTPEQREATRAMIERARGVGMETAKTDIAASAVAPNAILEDYLKAERARKAAYMREYRARLKKDKR